MMKSPSNCRPLDKRDGARISELMPSKTPDTKLSPRARKWLAENRKAIEASNAWVKKHGLPLACYREKLWDNFRKG